MSTVFVRVRGQRQVQIQLRRELVQRVAQLVDPGIDGREELGGGFEKGVARHRGADDLGVELDDVDAALCQRV